MNVWLTIKSGIGPKSELQKHSIPPIVDLPVGENFSDHPFLATFWKVRYRGLSPGDMEMVTPDCDWTARVECNFLFFYRPEGEEGKALAEKSSSANELKRLNLHGRPHTESLVMCVSLSFLLVLISTLE